MNFLHQPPKFKVGDTVLYTNAYGIPFGEKTITEVEFNHIRGVTYYITPTDTPWFAVKESQLAHPKPE